jgi:predicted DCC family thiol-disulfide oxidoreductase YuxK
MDKSILLYDGVCNMCDSTVQFAMKRDRGKRIHYAGLQSSIARQLMAAHNIQVNTTELSTVYYIRNNKVYTKSTAILKVCMDLSGAWPLMGVFLIIPKFIRDRAYTFVAANRYRWFGKKDYCVLPSAEEKKLFLDFNERS